MNNQLSSDPVAQLRSARSSIKWTRYPADVLPLFVAEMDYPVAAPITAELIARVGASDLGYVDGPGPLTAAFSRFSTERWGWTSDPERVRIATDVSVGIVETLRYGLRAEANVVITPPVYPPFYELVEEAGHRRVEVPLIETDGTWTLDLAGLETAFAAGADAFLLCNPHNPIGIVHTRDELSAIAALAARYGVLVISDEVHGPLAHPGHPFTPFLAVAGEHGASAVTVTSGSKGWNLAGAKCALVIAGDAITTEVVDRFPEEVACRASILGVHANTVAFSCTDWLDDTVTKIVENDRLLASLFAEHLPAATYVRPQSSYLGWLDLRPLGLGDDPAAFLITHARVALNAGHTYGDSGRGFARINLACDPDVLRAAVERIAAATALVVAA
ncbi:MalY/PatB family protein [Mycetocola saprophilus]|uniref:MalY/PatB family protein n=1 Tax=Mycetocola saprophilus TaxID=76636 RepID=UPI0004C257FC|nr:aminotransferase class I/II-fold pyridoxal phosphate-dependent enzyme [Mycetocola saprophilus]